MATKYSRTETLAVGVNAIVLDAFGPVDGDSTGVHHRNHLLVIRHGSAV